MCDLYFICYIFLVSSLLCLSYPKKWSCITEKKNVKNIKKYDCSASTYCAWLCACFVCFRSSCLALRPQLLWNWVVWGNTLIATPCRVAEMYKITPIPIQYTCAQTHSVKYEHFWTYFYISGKNMSLSALLQCVLATYGILGVTGAAYFMHRQNKKETSSSTAWKIKHLKSDVYLHWGWLLMKWRNRKKSCDKVEGWNM